jgi:hypothetical protein
MGLIRVGSPARLVENDSRSTRLGLSPLLGDMGLSAWGKGESCGSA